MATIRRFEEINAWKTARDLTNLIYRLSDQNYFNRDFGLRDQIRRAALSVMSNIAEGFERQTQAMFIKYLHQAKASAGEVRSQLYIALDLGYISDDEFRVSFDLIKKVSSQLYRFIVYLQSRPNSRRISENNNSYILDQEIGK